MAKSDSTHIFGLTLHSADPQWERYNLFMTLVGYDSSDAVTSYCNSTDKISDPHPDDLREPLSVTGEPCDHAVIFVYAIAETFPASEVIRDSPSFTARLTVTRDGEIISDQDYDVNPWGGLTISALRLE